MVESLFYYKNNRIDHYIIHRIDYLSFIEWFIYIYSVISFIYSKIILILTDKEIISYFKYCYYQNILIIIFLIIECKIWYFYIIYKIKYYLLHKII